MTRDVARLAISGSLAALGLSLLAGCGRSAGRSSAPPFVIPAAVSLPATEASPFHFTEITDQTGVDFVHVSGMTEEKHYPTANGSGLAIFDANGDGWMDLYFANSTRLPLGSEQSGPNRFYLNNRDGTFSDATESSGLGFEGFCHGILAGDIDNDGDQDIYLCNYGPNVLFRNNGDGTFVDASDEACVACPSWSSSGAFLDYDRDGFLDLYVSNYGDWRFPDDARPCHDPTARIAPGEEKVRIYCSPRTVRTVKHVLYHNNGDGTFRDVTDAAGVGREDGHGFGVVAADLDGDGWTDLYVANDTDPNFLFLNNQDGTFRDVTEASGAAFNLHGATQSGMGVDAADVDGDGLPDLVVTNFENEGVTVYLNLGGGLFEDQTPAYRVWSDSRPWVGWGCVLADLDLDGWPDLFLANSHVDDNRRLIGYDTPYAQPILLFRNMGGVRFQRATDGAGPYVESSHVGRAVAQGDLDNDGDIDLVVSEKDGSPAILRNDTATKNRGLSLLLVGTRSNRDAMGARLEVTVGRCTQVHQKKGGTSLMSSHDPRILVGLGSEPEASRVVVHWPSGATSTSEHLPAGTTHTIVEPAEN